MQFNPYLFFNGDCETAFRFYAELLGGKIEAMITTEGSPAAEGVPADWQKKILHASLTANGQRLMGSDAPPGHFEKPQGFFVSINVASAAEADRIFAGLAKGGNVRLAIQETFFAERFGMVIDQYGTPWMVNYPKTP